jgi:Ca2+:H+ antiporter
LIVQEGWLLLKWFIPLSVILFIASFIGEAIHLPPVAFFFLTGVAIIPVAGWMGQATESLAVYAGPRVGGLLSATFGNAVELIIGIIALREGLQTLVKASITGSILGNLLFVLGISFLIGGIRHPVQRFNVKAARSQSAMLWLSIGITFILPAAFSATDGSMSGTLSSVAAIVALILYLSGLFFSLYTHRHLFESVHDANDGDETAPLQLWVAIVSLVITTIFVALESEWLVGAVKVVGARLGWSEVFMGVIVVAIVGNAAEHASAVWMAWKNKMELSTEIAVGSTLQVAMFVAPVLLLVSYAIGQPMTLLFSWPELVSMGAAVLLVVVLMLDGESNWLEGALALGAYLVMAVGFFMLKGLT